MGGEGQGKGVPRGEGGAGGRANDEKNSKKMWSSCSCKLNVKRGLTCSLGATREAKSAKLLIFLKLPRPSFEAILPIGVLGGLDKGSVVGDEVVVCVVGFAFLKDVARSFSSKVGDSGRWG